ncbi:MAG: queuosine precursor transporter [Mycobacteriaceae bacterium]|nr:queuosine precursor transporter [Mycobacteriaceae bacterium]
MRDSPAHAAYAHVSRGCYPALVALFTATLIVSNVCATKGVSFCTGSDVRIGPVQVLPLHTDGAFFLYPLAYVLGDVLSEVYGFRATRRAIYYGFAALALAAVCFRVAVELPPAEFYSHQAAFAAVIGTGPRVILASLAGYVVGQLLNALTMTAIKERTRERRLWARLIGSTVVGEFADTLVFCAVAAAAIGITTWRDFANYATVGFVWKTLVEIAVMPLTYRVIAFVKHREPTYEPTHA